MSKKGKIIFIVAALLIIGAIVAGVILGLRKMPTTTPSVKPATLPMASSSQPDAQNITSTETTQVPVLNGEVPDNFPTDLKRLTILTKNPVSAYWIASRGVLNEQIASSSPLQSIVFYMNEKGDIMRIHDDGTESVVSHLGEAPLSITQSVSGAKVVVKFISGSFALFDVVRGAFEFLPQGTISAAFSPDETKLAYLVANTSGKQELFVRDLTSAKKNITKLLSLSMNDMQIVWPVGTRIYFYPPQSVNVVGEIWYFDTITKTMGLFYSGSGIGALFSEISPLAVIFRNDGPFSINANINNIKTGETNSLGVLTLLSKCTFSLDTSDLLCAVPQIWNKMSNVQIPDDYNMMSLFTNDQLYRFSGSNAYHMQTLLSTTQAPFDAKNIISQSNQLFFVDRLTGMLYMFDMRGL